MKKFKLGDKVKFTNILNRDFKSKNPDYPYADIIVTWSSLYTGIEREGFIIRQVNKKEGVIETDFTEVEPESFKQSEPYKTFIFGKSVLAYEIAFNINKKTVLVSKEHLEDYNK